MLKGLSFLLTILAVVSTDAHAKLKVGTTTEDLEALVKAVGAGEVQTFSVAKGTQDPHQIEAKPSYMVKFRDADLIVSQGLELEAAWLSSLIQGARNSKINSGAKGYLELGPQLDPIEVAKGSVTRAEGDVHPQGNPHFQLDPVRLGRAAVLVGQRLGELDAAHADLFRANAETVQKHLTEKLQDWQKRIDKTGIKEFASYHKTLSYFAVRFGLTNSLQLEPKPGIPPTASHIIEVMDEMKKRKVRVVLIENFFDDSVRGKLEKEIPAVRVIKVPVAVGGEPGITTNEGLIERLVAILEAAAK